MFDVAYWFALSDSPRIEYTWGEPDTVTQARYKTISNGTAVAQGIQWCIGIGCKVQCQVEDYRDTRWDVGAYGGGGGDGDDDGDGGSRGGR